MKILQITYKRFLKQGTIDNLQLKRVHLELYNFAQKCVKDKVGARIKNLSKVVNG